MIVSTYIINPNYCTLFAVVSGVFMCRRTRLKLCQGSFPEYLMLGWRSFFGSVMFFFFSPCTFYILIFPFKLWVIISFCSKLQRIRCDTEMLLFYLHQPVRRLSLYIFYPRTNVLLLSHIISSHGGTAVASNLSLRIPFKPQVQYSLTWHLRTSHHLLLGCFAVSFPS